MVYIASELLMCRDSSSDPDHQAACVRQELTSGYPAGLAPCSSDAALCTAIAKFAKITASTLALTCTDTKTIGDGLGVGITGDRQGRLHGHLILTLIAAALASAGTNLLDTVAHKPSISLPQPTSLPSTSAPIAAALASAGTNPLDTVAHKPSISCTAISPPALRLPCIFPFHQGEDGPMELVAGRRSPVVHNGCATDSIVEVNFGLTVNATSLGKKNITIMGEPAEMTTIGLNDALRWCATAVDSKAATNGAARGSSVRGNAVNADRMVRWRYCGACIV